MDEYMIKAVVDSHNQKMAKSKPVQKSKVMKDYAEIHDLSDNNCIESIRDTATAIANYVAIRHTWVDVIDVYLYDERADVKIVGIETDERFRIDIQVIADEYIRVFTSDWREGTFGRNDYQKVFNSASDVESFLDECLDEYSSGLNYEASASKKSKAKKSKVRKDEVDDYVDGYSEASKARKGELKKMLKILEKMEPMAQSLVELDANWDTYDMDSLKEDISDKIYAMRQEINDS